MKTRRFDFNFKPLQISVGMLTEGSVSGRQSYDADADVYTPDYTLTPCIIQPQVGRLDKDEVLTPGLINSSLTNITWHETIGGTRTQIQAANTNYEMTTSGVNAGHNKMKKNAMELVFILDKSGSMHGLEADTIGGFNSVIEEQ